MKRILLLTAIVCAFSAAFGQAVKISDMPAASSLAGTELVPIVQGGVNKKATVSLFYAPSVLLSGSYSNPSWITSLDWSKITSTPTTLSGFGITDAWRLPSGGTLTGPNILTGTTSNTLKAVFNGLNTTQTDGAGWWLANTTVSTAGIPQNSPSLVFQGEGWSGGGASVTSKYRIFHQTNIGSGTNTISDLVFGVSKAGAAYTDIMTLKNDQFGQTNLTVGTAGNGSLTLSAINGLFSLAINKTNGGNSTTALAITSIYDAASGASIANGGSFGPVSSGSTTYSGYIHNGTINQSGTATGTIRIMNIAPVITSVIADKMIAFDWNPSGAGISTSHLAYRSTSGSIFFANSSSDTPTANTRLDIRGVASNNIVRFASSANTAGFTLTDAGVSSFGGDSQAPQAFSTSDGLTINNSSGKGLLITSANTAFGNAYQLNINNTFNSTSNAQGSFKTTATFNPTSGTATYTGIATLGTINQTGGANGAVVMHSIAPTYTSVGGNATGIDYNPTVTSITGTHTAIRSSSGNWTMQGSATVFTLGGGTTASELRFLEPSGSGSNFTSFKSVAQGADITYSLPPTVGATNSVLTDVAGNGVLSWTVPGGGITNSAANTELMVSNGTNAIGGKIFSPANGNITFGDSGLAGADRVHLSEGSATNVGHIIRAKGDGSITLEGSNMIFKPVAGFGGGQGSIYIQNWAGNSGVQIVSPSSSPAYILGGHGATTASNFEIRIRDASGTNIDAPNFYVIPGVGTGTGKNGNIAFFKATNTSYPDTNFGSAGNIILISNRSTVPTSAASGGTFIYSESANKLAIQGDLQLGDAGLSGTTRTIQAAGSATNIDIALAAKGTGIVGLNGNRTQISSATTLFIDVSAANTASISVPNGTDIFMSAGGSATTAVAGRSFKLNAGDAGVGNADGGSLYLDGGTKAGSGVEGNVALLINTVSSWGGMGNGLFIAGASANPSSNPTAGGFFFSDAADSYKPKWRVPGGTVYDLTGMAKAAAPATTGTMTTTLTALTTMTITPTGACTFNASGGVAGQSCAFVITTSGTTSFVLTWGTNFKTTGTLATGTVTAKVFVVDFIYDGTNWNELSRTTAM